MHRTTQLLHRQLHAYSDAWRSEGGREVAPWELEGWLEAGVSLFRLIRRLDEHLGETGAASPRQGSAAGKEVDDLYAEWLGNAAGPLGRLNDLESRGCSVADAAEFRDAEREARGVLRVPLDAVMSAGRAEQSAGPVVPEIGAGVGQAFPA